MNADTVRPVRTLKDDRNTHDFSAEESGQSERLDQLASAGGYRSRSVAAGTSDRPGPGRAATVVRPRAASPGHALTVAWTAAAGRIRS